MPVRQAHLLFSTTKSVLLVQKESTGRSVTKEGPRVTSAHTAGFKLELASSPAKGADSANTPLTGAAVSASYVPLENISPERVLLNAICAVLENVSPGTEAFRAKNAGAETLAQQAARHVLRAPRESITLRSCATRAWPGSSSPRLNKVTASHALRVISAQTAIPCTVRKAHTAAPAHCAVRPVRLENSGT